MPWRRTRLCFPPLNVILLNQRSGLLYPLCGDLTEKSGMRQESPIWLQGALKRYKVWLRTTKRRQIIPTASTSRAKFCSTLSWYESEAMSCKSKDIITDLFLMKTSRIRHHLGLGSYILHTKYLRLFVTRWK